MSDWDEIMSRQSHQSCCANNENVILFLFYFLFFSLFKNTPATAIKFLISCKTRIKKMRQDCDIIHNLLKTVTNTTNFHQEGKTYRSLTSRMLHAYVPSFESPDYRNERLKQHWSYCRRHKATTGKNFNFKCRRCDGL